MAGRTAPAYAPWRRRQLPRPRPRPYKKLERRVLWAVPLATFLVILFVPFYIDKAIAAVAGAIALTWLGRKPGYALKYLIIILPFSLLILSFLFKEGLPAQFVRPAAFWKEAMIGGVVVGGIIGARRTGIKADLLDLFCLGYIALGLAYLLAPGFFVNGIGAGIAFGTRINGFRYDVVYIVLFLAARHARIPSRDVLKAGRAFCLMAMATGALSVYEFFRASSWNNFVIRTIGLPSYKFFILNINPGADRYFYDIRVYTAVAGRRVLRVGGVVVNFQSFAFMLLIAVAILAEMQVRRRVGRRGWIALAFPLTIVGVILTQTRSALLALGAILLLAVLPQPGRLLTHRVRLMMVAGGLALLAVPIVFNTGLTDRLAGKDDESSNEGHKESVGSGIDLMFDQPLGTGLATGGGAGQRAGLGDSTLNTSQYNVSENQFLQIGTQLGFIGLALWVGVYITALRAMSRALRRASDGRGSRLRYGGYRSRYRSSTDSDPESDGNPVAVMTSGTRMALLGMLPTMVFLQPFIFFEVSWALWGLAGAALGCLEVAGTANDPDIDAEAGTAEVTAAASAY